MKRRRRPGLKEYQLTSSVRSLSRSDDYTFAPIIYQPIMARDLSLSSRFCNDGAMDVQALSKGSRPIEQCSREGNGIFSFYQFDRPIAAAAAAALILLTALSFFLLRISLLIIKSKQI